MPHPRVFGLPNPRATPIDAVQWEDLWTTPFPTDAHFVGYSPQDYDPSEDEIYRRNKASNTEENPLVTQVLVFDFDLPNHERWLGAEEAEEWLEGLDLPSPLCDWSVIYTTRSGARLVYRLDREVPVVEAEAMHRWLCRTLRQAGVLIDDEDGESNAFPTSDWTRLFRLPCVNREGFLTHEAFYFLLELQPNAVLAVNDLGSLGKVFSPTVIGPSDVPCPDPQDALNLMEAPTGAGGRYVATNWSKAAKRALKGRDCSDYIYGVSFLESGKGNTNLTRYVGQACNLLHRVEHSTEPKVFAVFLNAIQETQERDERSDAPDWGSVLWGLIQRFWAAEETEAAQRRYEREIQARDTEDKLGRMIRLMREWCTAPALHDDDTAEDYVKEHAILSVAGTRDLYVIQPNGRYSGARVIPSGLVAWVREQGMDDVIPLNMVSADGRGTRKRGAQEIIDDQSTRVAHVEGVPGYPGEGGLTATIRGIGDQDATLVKPLYQVRPGLTPQFNRHIANWLAAMFGDYIDDANNWLAHALDIHKGAICALSVAGPPGIGKKLIVSGLAECFTRQYATDAEDLTGPYQHGIVDTPVLSVDEGWPKANANSGKHVADTFRELVSGGRRRAQLKYLAPMSIMSPMRVILSANNLKVVTALGAGRDLSPDDRAALSVRLMHFNLTGAGAEHLRSAGGLLHHTMGWIAGDGGQPSDYTVARHFLWLNREWEGKRPPGTRLLVEGNECEELMHAMRVTTGAAPFVVEALLKMIESMKKPPKIRGLFWCPKTFRLMVLSTAVLEYFRSNLANDCGIKLSTARIGSVLKGLGEQIRAIKGGVEGTRTWVILDLRALLAVAEQEGWECRHLNSLIAKRDALDLDF